MFLFAQQVSASHSLSLRKSIFLRKMALLLTLSLVKTINFFHFKHAKTTGNSHPDIGNRVVLKYLKNDQTKDHVKG